MMSNSGREISDKQLTTLEKKYKALMEDYNEKDSNGHNIIDRWDRYKNHSIFFSNLDKTYQRIQKTLNILKTIPTPEDIETRVQEVKAFHNREIQAKQKIKDKNKKKLEQHSLLIDDLKKFINDINDINRKIADTKAEMTNLEEANKNADIISLIINKMNISDLEQNLSTLKEKKKAALNLLCQKLNNKPDGDGSIATDFVGPDKAYEKAFSLLIESERLKEEMKDAEDWLKNENDIISKKIDREKELLEEKRHDARNDIYNHFTGAEKLITMLSEQVNALKERENIIEDKQKKIKDKKNEIENFNMHLLPEGSTAVKALKDAQDQLDLMKLSDLSEVTRTHTNSEGKKILGTNEEYENKINEFIKIASKTILQKKENIKKILKDNLNNWNIQIENIRENLAGHDMPGPTRSQVRTMFSVMDNLANGENKIEIDLSEITGEKNDKIITLNLTAPDFATTASAFFQKALLTEEQTRIILDMINNQSVISQKEIKNLIEKGDFSGASALLHEAEKFLKGFESQISTIIQEAARTSEYKEEVKVHEEKVQEVREEVQKLAETVQKQKIERLNQAEKAENAHIDDLDNKTQQLVELIRKNNPKINSKIETKYDSMMLANIREQLKEKISIRLLDKGFRFFGNVGLMDKFILPSSMLTKNEKNKKVSVTLNPEEKALLGNIFAPQKDQDSRTKIYKNIANKEQKTPPKNPTTRKPR